MRKNVETDYDLRSVEAARRVLLELTRVFSQYEDDVAVVGGWVRELLIPGKGHIGSTDVDIALDQDSLTEPRYATLRTLLLEAGYREDPERNFVFFRDVALDDDHAPDPIEVEVDLVAAEYGLAGKNRQSQAIQDVRARKARGADLLITANLVERVEIEGTLPNKAVFGNTVRVAGPLPFLVMKANAITGRDKPKDAYAVWFVISHHPAGLDGLASMIREHVDSGLVREALGKLDRAFETIDHIGPVAIALFLELERDSEEFDRMRQDAFQKVRYILERVDS